MRLVESLNHSRHSKEGTSLREDLTIILVQCLLAGGGKLQFNFTSKSSPLTMLFVFQNFQAVPINCCIILIDTYHLAQTYGQKYS